jgi:L,D-transpeptidase ErfK/SrfK
MLFATLAAADEAAHGLPADAPDEPVLITVDVSTNTAYLYENRTLVAKSPVATGTDELLRKGSRVWLFRTPRGVHRVVRKVVDPVWRKPDWAFIEEGKKIPSADSPTRLVRGKLGKYALDLGDGIMLHGTDDPKSIGKKASHGCIRVPDKMLRTLYAAASAGTPVYIFDSAPSVTAGTGAGMSDLDLARGK